MKAKKMTTNMVAMTGQVEQDFRYSYDYNGENYYQADLLIRRRSLAEDRIPLVVPEHMLDPDLDYTGAYVDVQGQFLSRNNSEDAVIRTSMSVLADNLELSGDPSPKDRIYLEGYVCRPPMYRKTPSGKEITEIILAVDRGRHKTDYIPCITWSRTARFAAHFSVGEHLLVWGRIQSREYVKRNGDEEHTYVTYEVSVVRIEIY